MKVTSLVKKSKSVQHGGQEVLIHYALVVFQTLNLPIFYSFEPSAVPLRYPVCLVKCYKLMSDNRGKDSFAMLLACV